MVKLTENCFSWEQSYQKTSSKMNIKFWILNLESDSQSDSQYPTKNDEIILDNTSNWKKMKTYVINNQYFDTIRMWHISSFVWKWC